MYLCNSLTWNEKTRKMCGVLEADVVMHAKPQGRGYVRLQQTAAHPWPSDQAAATVSAHEFHYSALVDMPDALTFAYDVERGFGLDGQRDGLVYRNLLASYAHLRDTRSHPWARRFVDFVRARRGRVAQNG